MVTALHMRKVHLVRTKEARTGRHDAGRSALLPDDRVPSDQHQIAGDEGDGVWVRVPGRKFVGTQAGFS